MDQTQRNAVMACLNAVFGDGPDDLIAQTFPHLELLDLKGGQTLLREADPPDAVYFVISGRLRTHVTREGQRATVDEFIRGETVGEATILMKEPHPATIIAVRDSVLARLPASAF